ncbi:MAG: type II toxin-antitoxin system VapC family toxin [Thermoplasmatota archaeon]
MKIFLDSTIFFEAVAKNSEASRLKTLLRHAVNDKHILVTSLTVYGEIVQVCIRDDRDNDLKDILKLIADLDIQCWLPNPLLRDCCKCLDKKDKENRVGLSDRTHLAYSMSYGDDYFLTLDKDLLHFPIDRCKCKRCDIHKDNKEKIISPKELRKIL